MDEPPFALVCGWRYPLLIIAKGGSFSTVLTLRLFSSTSIACGFLYEQKQGAPCGRTLPKSTYDNDMYNRAFPVGNALSLFAGGVMSLFRLPRGKLPLPFFAVPAGKDGRVECPRQTVDDFIGIRGSVCGLFLFVQTHAPLTVPPWQSRARKSKFQFLSGARARKLSALHLRLVAH